MGLLNPLPYYELLMPQHEANALHGIVSDLKPNVAVEIGSWAGGSSTIIADAGADYLFCVDPWDDYEDLAGFDLPKPIDYTKTRFGSLSPEERFVTFCRNLGGRLFHKVFPCRGASEMWASAWILPIDFLFIDGCHSYEAVKTDIESWLPHVKAGGVILGHDYLKVASGTGFIWEFPGVAQAVHEKFENFYIIPSTTFWMVVK